MKGQNNELRQQYEISQMDEVQWSEYRRRKTRREMNKVGKDMKKAYEYYDKAVAVGHHLAIKRT